jgi:hypothetical protein
LFCARQPRLHAPVQDHAQPQVAVDPVEEVPYLPIAAEIELFLFLFKRSFGMLSIDCCKGRTTSSKEGGR